MGKEERIFKSEERVDRAYAADFIQQIAAKLAEGQVILRKGTEELAVEIPGQLVLEVQVEKEHKTGGLQHSLEIELKWREGAEAGPLELG